MERSAQVQEIQPIHNLIASLQSFSKKASVTVILIGCVVIVGWIFNIAVLKSILPGLVTMKANTATGFILGGLSLWLKHQQPTQLTMRRAAFGCAILVLLIGLLTMMEYGLHIDLGIDQLLFEEPPDAVATATPGRMAPNTALSFFLVGSALVLLSIPRLDYGVTQFFSLVTFAIAFLGLLGYIYGNAFFYQLGPSFTAMALHTAVAFILLCSAILFYSPKSGVMAVVTKNNAGGIVARRLSLLVIIIPSALGWFILSGYRSKVYTPELGISLLSMLNIIVFGVLIWWNAKYLGIVDDKRSTAEVAVTQAFEELEHRALEQERLAIELATAVNQVTTTMQQLEASSRITAEQAFAADAEARRALTLSEKGSLAVQRTQEGMTMLQEKVKAMSGEIDRCQKLTNQIGDISSMVKDLASQTNMLALNAAIEAVRAGEHGKGFGVVAEQIRKLADQSKSSADSINTLVADIQTAISSTIRVTDEGTLTVQSGVDITTETADAFQGVAEAINQIFLLNQEISLTAKQQALAIQQVVSAMNAINTRT